MEGLHGIVHKQITTDIGYSLLTLTSNSLGIQVPTLQFALWLSISFGLPFAMLLTGTESLSLMLQLERKRHKQTGQCQQLATL